MKPFSATFVVASLLVAGPTLHLVEPDRNLWVGVLQDDLLIPVGALVNGRWSFRNDADDAQREALWEAEGKLPARWLPIERALPRMWRARMFTGETRMLHISGPLVHNQFNDEQRAVRTDLRLPAEDPRHASTGYRGVAFAGSIGVRLFSPVAGGKRGQLLRFLNTAVQAAERAATKGYAESGSDFWEAMPGQAEPMPGTATLEVVRATKSAQPDRSILYFLEGSNALVLKAAPEAECLLRVDASVSEDPSGRLRLLGAWANVWFDGSVDVEPLAVLERGGTACWLNALIFEDGFDYTLTKPGHDPYTSDCALK